MKAALDSFLKFFSVNSQNLLCLFALNSCSLHSFLKILFMVLLINFLLISLFFSSGRVSLLKHLGCCSFSVGLGRVAGGARKIFLVALVPLALLVVLVPLPLLVLLVPLALLVVLVAVVALLQSKESEIVV